jgi:hypothetical protein
MKITSYLKKGLIAFLMILFMGLSVNNTVCAQEQEEVISLVTHYPAPYGIYNTLRSDSFAVGENASMPDANGVFNFMPITQPPAGIAGDIYYDVGSEDIKYHDGTDWFSLGVGKNTPVAIYASASDSTERTINANNSWNTNDNLSCTIDVNTGDIVMVVLEGEFWHSDGADIEAFINLHSGPAVPLTNWNNACINHRYKFWLSASTTRMFQANGNGQLNFRMRWKGVQGSGAWGNTSKTKNRTMKAWVIR